MLAIWTAVSLARRAADRRLAGQVCEDPGRHADRPSERQRTGALAGTRILCEAGSKITATALTHRSEVKIDFDGTLPQPAGSL